MIPGVPGVWRQYDEQLILWTPFWADGPSGGTSENCVGVNVFIFELTSKILPLYEPPKVTFLTHILLFPPHRSLLQWTLWPGSGGTTPVTHLTIMFVKEINELQT